MLVEAWHHLFKGSFLQGKRNRRLDHLIYVLVDHAIPHFIEKHHRQEAGFEGADLEVQERIAVEGRAKSIKITDITKTNEDNIYLVKSQSIPDMTYCIDLDAYDCNCLSFPSICFCKHICAVQAHFPEIYKPVPTSRLIIHCEDSIDPGNGGEYENSNSSDSDSDEELNPPLRPHHASSQPESIKFTIINKLSSLAIRLQNTSIEPSATALMKFHDDLDIFIGQINNFQPLLPREMKIAPNKHSWPETAAVMNVPVKSKRKKHVDPYGGGERSGKKAKTDARQPVDIPAVAESSTRPLLEPPCHDICVKNLQPQFMPPSQPLSISVAPPLPSPCIFHISGASHVSHPVPLTLPTFPPVPLFVPALATSMVPQSNPGSEMSASESRVPQMSKYATPDFDPTLVDLRNTLYLRNLKRPFLTALCYHYGISAGGTNIAIIDRLQQKM